MQIRYGITSGLIQDFLDGSCSTDNLWTARQATISEEVLETLSLVFEQWKKAAHAHVRAADHRDACCVPHISLMYNVGLTEFSAERVRYFLLFSIKRRKVRTSTRVL